MSNRIEPGDPGSPEWLRGHPMIDPGWITGSMAYPAPPRFDGEPDEFEGDTSVGYAVAALRAFAGDLSRERAAIAVRMWVGYRELTSHERIAVLQRFPRNGDRTDCRVCGGRIERTRDEMLPWRHINTATTCATPEPAYAVASS